MDISYLKNVLIGAFEAGELPATSAMVPVLARLLEFSPQETERIRAKAAAAARQASGGLLPGGVGLGFRV